MANESYAKVYVVVECGTGDVVTVFGTGNYDFIKNNL